MLSLYRTPGFLLLGLVLGLLTGCHDRDDHVRPHRDRHDRHTNVDVDVAVGNPEPDPVYEPEGPPVVMERGEPDAVIVERSPVYIVREAPPAVIVERRPPPPRYAHIWVEGYWHHDGHRFVWEKGHYDRDRHGHHYVQPRWIHGHRGWEFHAGHWN